MAKWTKRRGLEKVKKSFSFWFPALWENDSSGLGYGGLDILVLEVSLAPEQAFGAGTGGCFSLACEKSDHTSIQVPSGLSMLIVVPSAV